MSGLACEVHGDLLQQPWEANTSGVQVLTVGSRGRKIIGSTFWLHSGISRRAESYPAVDLAPESFRVV